MLMKLLFNHFQTLTPLQQKAVQVLMTLKLLEQNEQQIYDYLLVIT